jgi:AcrR family transcriptional regulator
MQASACIHIDHRRKGLTEKRPKEKEKDARQRILEAAFKVSVDFGVSGVTTKAIAKAAGVNEVTLFRHFGTKEKLLSAAIDQFGGPALAPAMESHFTGEYRRDLINFGTDLLNILHERREVLLMLLCESVRDQKIREIMARNPREIRKMLARYFKSQIDKGTIKEQHPEAMAQAFLGMFFAYAVVLDSMEEAIDPLISNIEIVTQFVDIFIEGTLKI